MMLGPSEEPLLDEEVNLNEFKFPDIPTPQPEPSSITALETMVMARWLVFEARVKMGVHQPKENFDPRSMERMNEQSTRRILEDIDLLIKYMVGG